MDSNEKNALGQVFTSELIANLMATLLVNDYAKNSSCLDPCIGKNVFLSKLKKLGFNNLTGIELDSSLLTPSIHSFFNNKSRNLIVGDFFEYSLQNKFDLIILNPPYVRHEVIGNSPNNKKINFSLNNAKLFSSIPKKSNLYIYFLIKALNHLKDNGMLICIVYDSWLYTDYGKIFKDMISTDFCIKKIVHFRQQAFDGVNVGATIILFKKEKQSKNVLFYQLDSPKELNQDSFPPENKIKLISFDDLFNHPKFGKNFDFDLTKFTSIQSISSKPIQRGLETLANSLFIFDNPLFGDQTKPLIKDVTKISSFIPNMNELNYVLQVNSTIPQNVKEYFNKIKQDVPLHKKQYKTLYQSILKKTSWYYLKPFMAGNIIFNYYMRSRIDFFLNKNNIQTSNNFYNLYVEEYVFENFAIINSTVTKFNLLNYGKSQGRGLFKIQLNKFKELPIVNIKKLPIESQKELKNLGEQLSVTKRNASSKIINKIDSILLKEISNTVISQDELKSEICKLQGSK